jgi:UDP-glucose 6-dehydrogenase
MKPDRVVIGTKSEKARKVMKLLYEPFVRQGNPIYFMDDKLITVEQLCKIEDHFEINIILNGGAN